MILKHSELFLVGSGGHALSVLSSLKHDSIKVHGVLDPYATAQEFEEFIITKKFQDIPERAMLVIAIGDNYKRERIFEEVLSSNMGHTLFTHISSKAMVSNSAKVLEGAIVLPGGFVGPKTLVGTGALINTNAVVEHQSALQNFASLAPGALILGGSVVGHGSHVGPASIIDSKISMGANSILGANSYLRCDLPELVIAYGNPAFPKRSRQKDEPYLR